MSIESVLHGILAPVFGAEVYPVVHPDPDGSLGEVSDIYAIFIKVGGAIFPILDGESGLSRPRLQISVYSSMDFDALLVKEGAVIAAMTAANLLVSQAIDARVDPFTVSGALANSAIGEPTHGYERETKRYVSHLEYYCWSRR